MIADELVNFEKYQLFSPESSAAIRQFIAGLSADTPDGRYEIDGDRIFAMVQRYETKLMETAEMEAHRKYLDIQLLLEGEESIYCGPVDRLQVTRPYSGDIVFYRFEHALASRINMMRGMFAVFFPFEGHMPGISVDRKCLPVRKVVIKVAM